MPLVRITLFKGRPPEQRRAIADAVHEALVETYGVPREDRFQVMEEREPGEIIYDPTYLGIARTDGLVIVHIVASDWRDWPAKQALYRSLTDRLVASCGMRGEDVQVIISPNDRTDWCFGKGVGAYPPQ